MLLDIGNRVVPGQKNYLLKRTDLIKKLIGLFGIGILPTGSVQGYRKVYLLQSFIRGYRFYQGSGPLQNLNLCGLLILAREHDNVQDVSAILLYYNNQKIGHTPAEEDKLQSRGTDAGVNELLAGITHLDIDRADDMKACMNDNWLVVTQEKLLADLQQDSVADAFDEQGYVVVHVNRVAKLSARIVHLVPVKDKKAGS